MVGFSADYVLPCCKGLSWLEPIMSYVEVSRRVAACYPITGVRGFRWAIENVSNRQPTACSTSSPPSFCFLGGQQPKTGTSPIRYVLPNLQAIDCQPSSPPFTTSAV